MQIDKYGQVILSENDMCSMYMRDPDHKPRQISTSANIQFSDELELDDVPKITKHLVSLLSVEQYDTKMQSKWLMPEHCKNFDIAEFVLSKCKNDEELQRAAQELFMFQERDMFDFLNYLKYLVDTMRKNNVIWGVGRGSSIASFVLYLIGVHRINSLYYQIPIEEFLKGEVTNDNA